MKNLRKGKRPAASEGRITHTRSDIEYRAAPYGFIAVIPKGTAVVEAKNLPSKKGPRWWALQWPGMKESEESWLRNYGFLLEDREVKACKGPGQREIQKE